MTKQRKRLLFTGGGGASTEAITRLWKEKYDLFFADASAGVFPPNIAPEQQVVIPFAKDPDFLPALKKACASRKIDVLIPGVDEELEPIANQHDREGWPEILLPPLDFVTTMNDKQISADAIAAKGLNSPQTMPLIKAHDMAFPLIAKPRSGRGSRGVMVLERPEQIEAYLALQDGSEDEYVAQRLVTGQEYTVFVAVDNNHELRAVIPVLVHDKRGITVRAQTTDNRAIIDYAKDFHKAFGASGIYNIQCMLDENEQVYPFEVNPRISTTFCLAIATGFDPVQMMEHDGDTELFTPSQQISLRRSWYNTIEPLEKI